MAPQNRISRPKFRIPRALRALWRGLREWCGDAAYDRYLAAKTTREGACRKLTRTEFYLEQADRRYSRPNRCC
jgi:uncharacterized short protein YbdD (DUF466 family)